MTTLKTNSVSGRPASARRARRGVSRDFGFGANLQEVGNVDSSVLAQQSVPARQIGRYALHGEIASGGMATVHLGRLLGPVGFSRTVAVKRLHPQFAKDPEFVSMFLDEARLAARIRHPNVVATLDVVATEGELFLVMDYVQGESLSKLIRLAHQSGCGIPARIVAGIVVGALHGLHAAHEAKNERGESLGIVHRDISPQNVLVGADGVARVLDFGVAKAAGRLQTTREGQLKGKLAYMAPEQITGTVTRQTDVYAAAIVLWEALTARRLFGGGHAGEILAKVMNGAVKPPSHYVPGLSPGLDEVVLRGLRRSMGQRYATAREFAVTLEQCTGIASPTEIGEWVEDIAHETLTRRAERVAEVESNSSASLIAPKEVGTVNSFPSLEGSNPASAKSNVGHEVGSQPGDISASAAELPVSQVSSISVSNSSDTAASHRNAVRYAGLGAGVLLVVFAGAWALRGSSAPAAGALPARSSPVPSTGRLATEEPRPSTTASAAPVSSAVRSTAARAVNAVAPSATPTPRRAKPALMPRKSTFGKKPKSKPRLTNITIE